MRKVTKARCRGFWVHCTLFPTCWESTVPLESLIRNFFVGATMLMVLLGPSDLKSFTLGLSVQERKTVKQNTLVSCYGLYTLSVRPAFRVSFISGMEKHSKRTGCCVPSYGLCRSVSFRLCVYQRSDLPTLSIKCFWFVDHLLHCFFLLEDARKI